MEYNVELTKFMLWAPIIWIIGCLFLAPNSDIYGNNYSVNFMNTFIVANNELKSLT